jgi:hypothetical protein
VFYYFTLWRQDGPDQRIQEILRCQVRERSRRLEDPSLVIIDTQSVRVAAGVPKETTGLDANKKTPGRKRGLAVDVLGLIIGVVIVAASAHDNEAGIALLDQAAERTASDPGRSALVRPTARAAPGSLCGCGRRTEGSGTVAVRGGAAPSRAEVPHRGRPRPAPGGGDKAVSVALSGDLRREQAVRRLVPARRLPP